jgi:hypothetical protein
MHLRLGTLRRLIRESILLEYDVSPNATLYHRSPIDFKVGDVLTAQKDPKTGQHWLASKRSEQALERYRQQNHPDLPSRFDCVFASFNPRSRFLGKGKLYAIKPEGKMFVTDSNLIDQMARNDESHYSSRQEIEEYWDGIEPNRRNINDVEILMKAARVVDVIGEQARIVNGTRIAFGPGAPRVRAHVSVFGSESPTPKIGASDGNTFVSVPNALERLEVDGTFVSRSMQGDKYSVVLGPGFEGFVTSYRGSDPGMRGRHAIPSISVSTGAARGPEGVWIYVDEPEKFIKAFRAGKIEKVS